MSESRRVRDTLSGRTAVRYTVFRHLDPTKGKPSLLPLARELVRFAGAIYPLFKRVTS